MKVGDLVTLSAYGRARLYNTRLLDNESDSNVGLIVEVRVNRNYPYLVKWSKMFDRRVYCDPDPTHSRIELKYATR